jgi:hypothetical protein
MPQKLDNQPPPLDAPSSVGRIIDWQREHEKWNNRRTVAAGRLVSIANQLRKTPPDTLSDNMKNYYLTCVLKYADEFLEGR